MVEEVGAIRYHHFHRNHTWVGKCPMGSGRFYMGTKAAKRAVSHGKKTAFADDMTRYLPNQRTIKNDNKSTMILT